MPGNQPLVSILIPSYNYAHVIRRCVDKALAQRYKNIEVIIWDDASTDNTSQVLKIYENDPRVKMIFSDVNGGVTAAVEGAAKHALGEFITLCATDDQLMPNHVDRMIVPMLDPLKPADLAWGNINYMGSDGKAFPSFQMYPMYCVETGERNEFAQLISHYYMSGASMMFRRDVFEELGGWGENWKACQEHELPLRFADAGKRIIHVTLPTNMYLCHTEQFSRTTNWYNQLYLEYLDILELYATDRNAWRFRGYESRMLRHLNHLQGVPQPEVREANVQRHDTLVKRLNAYAVSPPPLRPKDVPRVSVIAVCDSDINPLLSVLDSLHGQSYTDWELVLFQYGIVSQEGLVLNHPAGHKVNFIYAPAVNPVSGWSAAQEMVRGELVTYLEQNVTLPENYLAELVSTLDAGQAGVVVGGVEMHLMQGVNAMGLRPQPVPADGTLDTRCFVKPFALKSSIMHRLDIFNFTGTPDGLPPKAFYGHESTTEAWDFVLRCLQYGIKVMQVGGANAVVECGAESFWQLWAHGATNGMLERLQGIYTQYPAKTKEIEDARTQFGVKLFQWLQSTSAKEFTPKAAEELLLMVNGPIEVPAFA